MASVPTVLVVDDYLDALNVWDLYLRGVGFNVLTAPDGHTAIALAEKHLPDLIVLDLELPGLSGFDVARRLRSQASTRHIPLIAATGYSHKAQLDAARESGVDAIVIKPCDPDALVGEIRRQLDYASGRDALESE